MPKRKSAVERDKRGRRKDTYNLSGLLPGGKPGNRGGGRPPESWKRWCRKLLSSKPTTRAIVKDVRNPKAPAHGQIIKMLASYAYGQPQAHIEVKGKLSLEQILARSWTRKGKGKKTPSTRREE